MRDVSERLEAGRPAGNDNIARPLLPRGLLIILGIAGALVAALGVRAFSSVLAPVFLGLVLSNTVQPFRR